MGYEPPDVPSDLKRACEGFLDHEAELLDDRRLDDWLGLLAEDVDYRVPIRTTRERTAETEFSDESYHLKEDRSSLAVRIERLENDFAWSEDPPSRNRRFVSNVRVMDHDPDPGRGRAAVRLRNNLLLFRSFDDDTDPDLLSAERHDALRRTDAGWWLAARTVYLDHTVVPTDSLTVIL